MRVRIPRHYACLNSLQELRKLKNFLILRIPREFVKFVEFLIRVAPPRAAFREFIKLKNFLILRIPREFKEETNFRN
jgi:hypothetical protein